MDELYKEANETHHEETYACSSEDLLEFLAVGFGALLDQVDTKDTQQEEQELIQNQKISLLQAENEIIFSLCLIEDARRANGLSHLFLAKDLRGMIKSFWMSAISIRVVTNRQQVTAL